VVVVPPICPLPFRLRRVLIPMEAVAHTAAAVQETLRRAFTAGLEVVVLHVMDEDSLPMFSDQPQHELEALAREFRLRYFPTTEVTVGVRAGSPAEEILTAMARLAVDLVVLAWSQRLAPGRALLVRSVLEHASVPVLLLPVAEQQDAASAESGRRE
jgi:nucleotide-binding universal stress UspA family protein